MAAEAVRRPWTALYDPGVPLSAMPRHATVLDALLHTAATDPEAVLLRYKEQMFTAARLDVESGRLAAALAGRGFEHGDRLAIFLQNVPEFVIGVLAAWKLGGIAVTVNPMYRERELAEVLRDSEPRVLLSEANDFAAVAKEVADACGVDLVVECGSAPGRIDGLAQLLAEAPLQPAALAVLPRAADAATFIYTSGTTGPLKAAVSTHAQLAYSAEVYRCWGGLARGDTIVAIAPLTHVTGMVGYIALALLAAVPLVLTYRFTPQVFRDAVRTHGGSFTIGPTTAFIALIDAADVQASDLATLDRPFSGGAPLPAAVVERYRAKFRHSILGIYGLTEATGPTHMAPRGCSAPLDAQSGTLAVGLPVPGIECRILDDDGIALPPLKSGELLLSGPQLASGYWRRDVETRATFTAHGLRTGDVGFMDAAGWLYLIDRKKDQINASGFKVWPREVEDVLYEHPAVLECAVIGLPDAYRGETVAAFVALRAGHTASVDDLAAFCRANMAAYKVPRVFSFLPELPKTTSGKVLRRALRALASSP